jgi:hypothetical protein
MDGTIPWGWQDTATLVGCVSILALAFWIRRRTLKGKAGGCSSGGCGSDSGPREPERVVIATDALSIGRKRR